jgi:hypothetical protein
VKGKGQRILDLERQTKLLRDDFRYVVRLLARTLDRRTDGPPDPLELDVAELDAIRTWAARTDPDSSLSRTIYYARERALWQAHVDAIDAAKVEEIPDLEPPLEELHANLYAAAYGKDFKP